MGSRPRRHLRLCPSRRETLPHTKRRPDRHRLHLDPLVPDHQAQELPLGRRQLLPWSRRRNAVHAHPDFQLDQGQDPRGKGGG